MRTIFLLLAVMLYGTIQSQIVDRITVDGEVIAQPGDDVQGINIINTTTNEGVITGAEGDFTIRVGVNDRLEVTAIQFQKFTIVVDKGIIAQKQLHIFLNESVNQLDEVIVTPYDLSGNIKADIQRVAIGEKVIPPAYSAAKMNDDDYAFSSDNQTRLDNAAAGGRRVRGELNFVNVIKALWKTTHTSIGDKNVMKEDVDFAVLGNGTPDLELGWTNQLTFGSWSVNAFFRGAFGHSLVNTFRAFYEPRISTQDRI